MSAHFIVSSSGMTKRVSDARNEQQEIQLKQNGGFAPNAESDAKLISTATEIAPTASV
jgi:hypothetical protein